VERTDAGEELAKASHLLREPGNFLLRHDLEDAVRFPPLELLEAMKGFPQGCEIGERSAEPLLRDVGHAAARGLGLHDLLGLLLGSDEKDQLAFRGAVS